MTALPTFLRYTHSISPTITLIIIFNTVYSPPVSGILFIMLLIKTKSIVLIMLRCNKTSIHIYTF